MERERWLALMWNTEIKLTREEIDEGWHFCREFDELLIDPLSPEWGEDLSKCRCGHVVPEALAESID